MKLKFNMFKGFLIIARFGKLGNQGKLGRKAKQIRQIFQLSLNLRKTKISMLYGWTKRNSSLFTVCIRGFELRDGVCKPCMPGFYKDWEGNGNCSACTAGRTSESTTQFPGAVSQDLCGQY